MIDLHLQRSGFACREQMTSTKLLELWMVLPRNCADCPGSGGRQEGNREKPAEFTEPAWVAVVLLATSTKGESQ
jgi:hypothetical protein